MRGQNGPIQAHPLASRRGHGIPAKGSLLEKPRPLQFMNCGCQFRRPGARRLKHEAKAVLQILKLRLPDEPDQIQLSGKAPNQPGQRLNHPRIHVGSCEH